MRSWRKIISSLLILCGLLNLLAFAPAAEDMPAGYITLSVEKFTLGQGYLAEPQLVPFYDGDTLASLTASTLGEDNIRYTGSIDSSFYLSAVRDDEDTLNVPAFILENLGVTQDELRPRQDSGWLAEFDHSSEDMPTAGWQYTHNNVMLSSSATDELPSDGDVLRWQFSIGGLGADLGYGMTGTSWVEAADKDDLTTAVATINSSPDRDSLLADVDIAAAYDTAIAVLTDLESTQGDVDDACSTLTDLLDSGSQPGTGDGDGDGSGDSDGSQSGGDNQPSDPLPAVSMSPALDDALRDTAQYVLDTVTDPTVGSTGGEWAVLGLARSGLDVPDSYYEAYYDALVETLQANDGKLSSTKYSDYSRVILALSAIGRDPSDVGGYNLLERLADFDKVKAQGVNGPTFALLALDCRDYEIPTVEGVTTQTTRDMLIEYILGKQLPDGGFDLAGESADPDVTAMALTALVPYTGRTEVQDAVDRALECISSIQLPNGGFESYAEENAESAAQVLIALSTLDIDPAKDTRFIQADGSWTGTALMRFYADGGFQHTEGGGVDGMATEQSLCALAAYSRMLSGETPLYDMSDVEVAETPEPTASPKPDNSGNSGGNTGGGSSFSIPASPSASAAPSAIPSATPSAQPEATQIPFEDLQGHWAAEAVNALYQRNIVTGVSETQYEPDRAMSRAEFCTILVKAFGLTNTETMPFTDVPEEAWYYGAVAAANGAGLVNGTDETTFAPDASITREAAAVIMSRAAQLQEQDVSADTDAALSGFTDGTACADWSRDAVAYCIQSGLMTGDSGALRPGDAVTRAEMAVIVSRLLNLLDM